MKNVIFAGVGGQGVILASKILMEVAMNAGYDVKESEVHGMAQRGGSVDCHVRFGEKVYSPLIERGTADYIVCFELLEIMRKLDFLRPEGKAIINTLQIDPAPVQAGLASYPGDLDQWLRSNVKDVLIVNADPVLSEVKSKRALNIVMLGVLSQFLEFSDDQWTAAIKGMVKEKFVDMNLLAFEKGRALASGQ
ncbi:MAG TPA: indolepyruvate oxidoreductase subunit beta [Spirochaetota bacterium]|nr:indolepyruvate oxidoreductase subunit beta [Spirochaetota bacterium]HPJ37067.1 indolepyruvate oxidoreductase subunit beta [Spirochaetota bacterium]HPQ52553.1 indolepyruvate oxidoreductase subunit beta [Spirochaetota bacterium]